VSETRQPFVSEMSRRGKIKFFLQYLKPQDRILEVGAGDGWFTRRLRERGFQCQTLDLVPPADFVGDINNYQAIGIAPASFDVIIAFEVIEHVDIVPAARKILRPGGLLMLTSPIPAVDPFLRFLEVVRLCQKRTSPHSNLTDFRTIPMQPVIIRKRLGMVQWGIFENRDKAAGE